MSISRDEARRIVRRIIASRENPKIRRSVRGGIVDLNEATINGQVIDISPQSVDRIDQTPGVANSLKAIVVDDDKSVSGINSLSVNQLFVNNQRVVIPEGVQISNSEYLRNVRAGVSIPKKAITSDSENSVSLGEVEANEIVYIPTPRGKYTPMATINDSLRYDTFLATSQTLSQKYGHYVETGGIVYLSEYGNQRLVDVPTTLTWGTDLSNLSSTNSFPSTRVSCVNESNLIYVPELNSFFIAAILQLSSTSFQYVVYRGTSLNSLTSQIVVSTSIADTAIWNRVPMLYWSSSNQLLVHLTRTTSNAIIHTSPDGINWTSRLQISEATGQTTFLATNGTTFYAITMTNSNISTQSSTDLITWTPVASANSTVFNVSGSVAFTTYTKISYDASSQLFYIGNIRGQNFVYTRDFLTFTTTPYRGIHYIYGNDLYICGIYQLAKVDKFTLKQKKVLPPLDIAYVNGILRICKMSNVLANWHGLHLYTELPDPEPIDIICYNPEQYLDMEPFHPFGMFDFAKDPLQDRYYVLGSFENNYVARSSNTFMYESQDLKTFTPISNTGVTCNEISVGGPNGDQIVVFASFTRNASVSIDRGKTWTVTNFGLTATQQINQIEYMHGIGGWLVLCFGSNGGSRIILDLSLPTTSVTFGGAAGNLGTCNVISKNYAVIGTTSGGSSLLITPIMSDTSASGMPRRFGKLPLPFNDNSSSEISYFSQYLGSISYAMSTNTVPTGIPTRLATVDVNTNPSAFTIGSASTNNIAFLRALPSTSSSMVMVSTFTGTGIPNGNWSTPIYIEPLSIFVAVRSNATTNAHTIVWSKTGINWNVIPNFRFDFVSTNSAPFKYNPLDGYLYVFTGTVTYRTKLSLRVHSVRPEHSLARDPFIPSNSVTLKELYEWRPYNLISGQVISSGVGHFSEWVVTPDSIISWDTIYSATTVPSNGLVSVSHGQQMTGPVWVGVGNSIFRHGTSISTLSTNVTTNVDWKSIAYLSNISGERLWAICGTDALGVWDGISIALTPSTGAWSRIRIVNGVAVAMCPGKLAVMGNSSGWTIYNLPGVNCIDVSYGCNEWVIVTTSGVRKGKELTATQLIPNIPTSTSVCFVPNIDQFVFCGNNHVTFYANGLNKSMMEGHRTTTVNGNWKMCHWVYRIGRVVLIGDNSVTISNAVSGSLDAGLVLSSTIENSFIGKTTQNSVAIGSTVIQTSNCITVNQRSEAVLALGNTTDNSLATITTGPVAFSHTISGAKLNLNASDRILTLHSAVKIRGSDISPLISINQPADASLAVDANGDFTLFGDISSKGVFINGELISQTIPPTGAPGVAESGKVCVAGNDQNITADIVSVRRSLALGPTIYTTLTREENLAKKPKVYISDSGLTNSGTISFIAYSSRDRLYYCANSVANSGVDLTTVAVSSDLVRWTKKHLGLNIQPMAIFTDRSVSNGVVNLDNSSQDAIMLSLNSVHSSRSFAISRENYPISSQLPATFPTSGTINTRHIQYSQIGDQTIPLSITSASFPSKYFYETNLTSAVNANGSNAFLGDALLKVGYALNTNSGVRACIIHSNTRIILASLTTSSINEISTNTPAYAVNDLTPVKYGSLTRFIFACAGGRILTSQEFDVFSGFANSLTLTEQTLSTTSNFTHVCYNPVLNRILLYGIDAVFISDAASFTSWTRIDNPVIPILAAHNIQHMGTDGWGITFSDVSMAGVIIVVSPTDVRISIVDQSIVAGKGVYAFGRFHIPANQVYPCRTITSPDGCTWAAGFRLDTVGFTRQQANNASAISPWICYSPSLNVMLVSSGLTIFSTTDGNVFTPRHVNTTGSYISDCIWVQSWNMFIAVVTGASSNNIITSVDGIIWTNRTIINASNLGLIEYSPVANRVLVVGISGVIQGIPYGAYSDDGITWVVPTNSNLPSALTFLSGEYLSYCSTRGVFVVASGTVSVSSNIVSISSPDGLQWSYFRVYNSFRNSSSFILRPITTINGLPEERGICDIVCTRESATNGSDPGDLLVIKNDVARVYLPIGSRRGGAREFSRIIYSDELKRLVVYLDSLPSLRTTERIAVIDIDNEFYPTENISTDILSEYIPPPPVQSMAKWKYHETTAFSFTGKIRWSPNNNHMIALCGSAQVTQGNHHAISATGFRWYRVSASTSVFQNTAINDVSFDLHTRRTAFGQSNGALICTQLPSSSGDQSNTPTVGALTVSTLQGTVNSRTFYSHKHGGLITLETATGAASCLTAPFRTTPFSIDFPTTTVGCVVSAPELNLIVIFPTTGNTAWIHLDNDWQSITLPISGNFVEAAYSPTLRRVVAITNAGGVVTTINGTSWQSASTDKNFTDIIWIDELSIFVASINDESTSPVGYTANGISWTYPTLPTPISAFGVGWNPLAACVTLACGTRVVTSVPAMVAPGNIIPRNISPIMDGTRGLWIGTRTDILQENSDYQLRLTFDSTFKPTTTSWTVSSDARIKENIEEADDELCAMNVNRIPLKRYKWKDSFIETHNVQDKHKLGWIAQDVEEFFPNSVRVHREFDIEDFRHLDSDQLIATMWGAIRNAAKRLKKIDQALDE